MESRKLFRSKIQLLFTLIYNGYLRDIRLVKAFLDVPLKKFIPNELHSHFKIYNDAPVLFYLNKVKPETLRTISAPHMISIMLQQLLLEEDDDLLILGAKSGYIAALAQKLAPQGKIVILEANQEKHIERIKKFATYINNNKDRIVNYEERKELGLVFTSNLAESTVESLINRRCKGQQHMRWSREGLNPILQLRAAISSNNDWAKKWKVAVLNTV